MPFGMMQSNAEIRSVATNSKRSPKSKTSRTLPLLTFLTPGKSSCNRVSLIMRAICSTGCFRQSAKVIQAYPQAVLTWKVMVGPKLEHEQCPQLFAVVFAALEVLLDQAGDFAGVEDSLSMDALFGEHV